MVNIFQDSTKSVPQKDNQIVRVTMEQNEIGGRKDHLPSDNKNPDLSIQHVPSAGDR